MGSLVEDKVAVIKSPARILSEGRVNKVIKRTREKKTLNTVALDAVIDAVGHNSPESEDTQDGKEKKSLGIVIDGKTYTCATCKTGHRVGICKHAKERPMTATHPPGRPPAGAPKKIVCDCPKQCACKKRDCKCARDCNCTQPMYMLVYVPAPGDAGDADDEKGTWKLGHQVTTDLKGNILTPDQIRERKEQKEARKTQTPETRSGSMSMTGINESTISTSPKGTELKPQAQGGCCKHKDNVATRTIATEAPPVSGKIFNSASGCNCGSACACAFCPEHPNNSTSVTVARQQAIHFANQPYNHDPQSIVSFMPTMPQGASCMGGLPQFAVSRFSQMPSFYDLQRAFPHPGYVIGYPIWSTRTDSAGYHVPPFPVQPQFVPGIELMDNAVNNFHTPVPTPLMSTPQSELPSLDFSQDEFGIGNAFVASAGPGGFDQGIISPDVWAIESSITSPMVNNFVEGSEFFNQPTMASTMPITPDGAAFDFSTSPQITDENVLFDFTSSETGSALPDSKSSTQGQASCCRTVQVLDVNLDSNEFPGNKFPSNGRDDTYSLLRQAG